MNPTTYARIALAGVALTLVVIMLGAYVRLSNAGLSCPDWPGCYGKVLVPGSSNAIAAANEAFPERPVDVPRAWKEMVHRYLAGLLGLVILGLAISAWRRRARPEQLVAVPIGLLALVTFQAALGMWTVTLLLKPIIVTAHLLGGMTTLALMWWLALRQGGLFIGVQDTRSVPSTCSLILVGIILLYLQITLGGWTSANYAALACPDFPTCQTRWLPPMDFVEALRPWHGLGKNYEGGLLDNEARVTIHMLHRLGAIAVTLYLGWLAVRLWRSGHALMKRAASAMCALLVLQVSLGISNVVFHLPLNVAVAHNGVAALLLLSMVCVYHVARPPPQAPAWRG